MKTIFRSLFFTFATIAVVSLLSQEVHAQGWLQKRTGISTPQAIQDIGNRIGDGRGGPKIFKRPNDESYLQMETPGYISATGDVYGVSRHSGERNPHIGKATRKIIGKNWYWVTNLLPNGPTNPRLIGPATQPKPQNIQPQFPNQFPQNQNIFTSPQLTPQQHQQQLRMQYDQMMLQQRMQERQIMMNSLNQIQQAIQQNQSRNRGW
jgi:hypothetical protein